jgi:hypothetical protein
MAYDASSTAGSELKYTVSTVLTLVRGIQGLSFSGGEKNDIEVTGIDDEDQVFIPGRRSAQELSFQIAYSPSDTVHAAMRTAYEANAVTGVAMTIVSTDTGAASRAFSGYVKQFTETFDRDGFLAADVVIKLTTPITLTP